MINPSNDLFRYINLSEFLKESELLNPYKESIFDFYGEQFLIAVDLWYQGRDDEALLIFDDVYEIGEVFFIHKFIRLSRIINEVEPKEILDELELLPYSDYVENLDKFLFHIIKAVAQFRLMDIDDCIKTIKESLEYIVDFTPVYLLLADCLSIRYQFTEAIEYYKIVLKNNDYEYDSAEVNLAYAYLQLKLNRKARKLFKKSVRKFPNNYKIQYNMALCYLQNNKLKKANEYLNIVEALNPNFSGLYLTKGGVLLKLNKKKEAILYLKKAEEMGNEKASNILSQIVGKNYC